MRIQGRSTTSATGDVYRTAAIDPNGLTWWRGAGINGTFIAEAALEALDVTKEGQRKGLAASPRRNDALEN